MIRADIRGDREVITNFRQYTPRAVDAIRRSINRFSLRLTREVKAEKLSGQVLKNRTGRLRRSITPQVTESSTAISSITGTNVEYAPPHEFGFRGVVTVRAHLRTIRDTGRQARVGAYPRKANLPERSFLRSALRELTPSGIEDLKKSVDRALRA